jgi:hypothetical protein
MYISGTLYDLERRIHQTCTNQESYSQYRAEFLGTVISDVHLYNRILKELNKKKHILGATDEDFEEGDFFLSENGDSLLLENNDNILIEF